MIDNPVHAVSQQANGSTSAPTTSSATFVVIPQMTLTMILAGGDVLIHFTGSFSCQEGDTLQIALFVDGVQAAGTLRQLSFNVTGLLGVGGTAGLTGAVQFIATGLTGSHTFDCRWLAVSGTARAITTDRKISATELP